MAEPKPLASLTSDLLARKGAAQPAMRRPMMGFGRTIGNAVPQEDLGWNDMGFDVEPVPTPVEEPPVAIGLTPMTTPVAAPLVPPVVLAREELAERIKAAPAPRKKAVPTPTPTPAPALAPGRKAAFTLRLEAERHLKLRLVCAVTGRSAQQIVTQALDDFIDTLPEIDRLTQQLPQMRGDKA